MLTHRRGGSPPPSFLPVASVKFCVLQILNLCVIMKPEGRDKRSPPASGGNFFEEAAPSDNLEQETQLNKEAGGAQGA